MSYMDEKIIAMMNELDNVGTEKAVDRQNQKEKPDVRQPLVRIGSEMMSFMSQSLLDDRIIVYMPKSFKLMTPKAAAIKYPSERRPQFIFTNDAGSINLTFNYTINPLYEEDIEVFKEEMVSMLQRMQPILQWYEDGVKEYEGHSIGYCEFLTPAMNVNVYNLMFFVSLEDRALLCSFNCTEDEKEDWKEIAKGMMDTLQLNRNQSESGGSEE
ncbi:hypothetical protein [Paenibacillus gorillae]|uniref:hypothetical protein n=1 Tax=Paenibacillus gorillae TaxID=1243662 RepID=UPI0004B68C72|nr:hypothetical protein [Paenibacillus gorillae]